VCKPRARSIFAVARTLQNAATGEGQHNNTQPHPFSQGRSFSMDGFASKVMCSLAFLGGGSLAANAAAACTIDLNSTDPATGTSTDNLQLGVQLRI
jgi:hypothetical protein